MANSSIVYFIERLGDRIILLYFAENVKREKKGIMLHAFERFGYPSVSDFTMKEWAPPGLFESVISNPADLPPDMPRLFPCPGNLFVYAPKKIAETGIFPSLTIPRRHYEWLKTDFIELLPDLGKDFVRPIVCFHPLLDAPYQRSRNHSFPQWKACMELVAQKGATVVRIGAPVKSELVVRGKKIYDLTPLNLTPSQSIAVISMCDVFVGGDTGMTHAAAALGKHIVAIYGDCTHMLKDKSVPNNIQPGDWDTTPYTTQDKLYVLRRDCGENVLRPIFSAEQILDGVSTMLNRVYRRRQWL